FQRFQKIVLQLRVFEHRLTHFLRDLTQLFEVRIADETQVEFQCRPIAAEIGDLSELSEGDRVDLAVLMPEADRAQGEPFDRTLGLPAVDIFPDAECVVGQIKNPRDDVAYKGLAAKGDRETEYRG